MDLIFTLGNVYFPARQQSLRSWKVSYGQAVGLKKCGHCWKQFIVKVGTIFESNHVPLFKWFQAVYLLASSKNGISAYQSHRMLGVRYKTAWFMFQRGVHDYLSVLDRTKWVSLLYALLHEG